MLEDFVKPGRGQDPSPPPILRVSGLGIAFGGVAALDDLSFDLAAGQILGIIGPNGAGKTTLFNCLSRLYTPDRGDILLNGKSILSTPSHRMAHLGVSRTFQNLGLIGDLSVFDNICLGTHAASSGNMLSDALNLPSARRRDKYTRGLCLRLLKDFDLQDHAEVIATELPFALQKRVELARAFAGQPKLLLLDEPAGGLNSQDVFALGGLIRHVRDSRNVAILVVEHHMGFVMSVSDKVLVLDFGRKIAEGKPEDIRTNQNVVSAYLGVPA